MHADCITADMYVGGELQAAAVGEPAYLYLQTSHCQNASALWLVLRHCSRHCLCTYLLLPEHMHGQIKGLAGSWLGEVSVSKQIRHVPSTGALLLLHEGALLPAEASLRRFLMLLLLWLWQISGAITTVVLSLSNVWTVCSRGVPSPGVAGSSGILNHWKVSLTAYWATSTSLKQSCVTFYVAFWVSRCPILCGA
jgi:hypothetical protein